MHTTLTARGSTRSIDVSDGYSLLASVGTLRAGRYDPTISVTESECWWARWTPEGAATLRLRREGSTVRAIAWGDGCEWTLERLPPLLGAEDHPERLAAPSYPTSEHPVLERTLRAGRLRMPATGLVSDHLVQTILEQKVTARGAHRSWSALVHRYGDVAPGPADAPVRLPPTTRLLEDLPYHAWHPLGVERRRAETISRACRYLDRLQAAVPEGPSALDRRLQAVRGIGPWTAAILRRTTLGDPDAVEVGDWNLPHLVTYNLAGERRGDDTRMLELLEPYRGQRGRVVLLLCAAGARPPRRTHRWQARDIRGQ